MPFSFNEKKISEKQFIRLLQKGSTVNLKGFKTNSGTVEGLLRFDENFNLKLEVKNKPVGFQKPNKSKNELVCPKCKKGTVIKGKTAYGCSNYKSGCDFKVSFETVRSRINGQKPTKELVYSVLNESI